MKQVTYLLTIAVLSAGLAACGGEEKRAPPEAASSSPVAEVESSPAREVSADANIFGAGRDAPPQPAGGGAGVLPPVWRLPAGSARVVTSERQGERHFPLGTAGFNGPAGTGARPA